MNAQIEQRTPEWYAQRIGRITASRVGAILGLGKFQTREDVLRTMVREALSAESEFTGNIATEYGQAHEADALAEYECQRGVMIEPCGLCVHPQHNWLAASPDGFVGMDGSVECKCPYRALYTAPSDEYRAQMQLQMVCANRAWCDFIVWRKGAALAITRVQRDDLWLARVLPELEAFMAEYRAVIADPERAAPHLAPKARSDSEWRDAAEKYLYAKRQAEDYEKLADHYKAVLSELAPEGAAGCGVSVCKVVRSGGYDYARAMKQMLPDVDLSAFKRADTTYFAVKEIKA